MQKACAYDVRKALIRDLLISIHKTRGFEWQTAHTKGCPENRCGRNFFTIIAMRKKNFLLVRSWMEVDDRVNVSNHYSKSMMLAIHAHFPKL